MNHDIEVHFQEGFVGQQIDISVDGQLMISFEARTRFQTGLAHIEPMTVREDQVVAIAIDELGIRDSFHIEASFPYVTVNLADGQMLIRQTEMLPGYL